MGLFPPRSLSVWERQRRQEFASGLGKFLLKIMKTTVKQEGKNHPINSLKIPMVISTPNLLLIPKNPGITLRHLRTAVEWVGPTAVYVLRNILRENNEKKPRYEGLGSGI